jgi:hypothetical protein
MAFDFPSAPTNGQIFSPAGGPTYVWHPPAWEVSGGGGGGASIIVSDTPPVGAPDNALWWDSSSGLLWLRFNDGTSTQWVIASPEPDFSTFTTKTYVDAGDANTLKYTAQALNTTQHTQARQNIFAAPYDSLAYNGMQINGSMDVAQERGGSVIINPAYVVDAEFVAAPYGTFVWSAEKDTADVPPGYINCVKISCTSAQTSLGPDDNIHLIHSIEGHRIARCAFGSGITARPMTIGEWVKWTPGSGGSSFKIYYSIRNGDSDRSYVAAATVLPNIWSWVTFTIPGCTDGVWPKTDVAGLRVSRCLATGFNLIGTANTWVAGNIICAADQTNFVAQAGNTMRFTGLIVLPGIEVPNAVQSPYIARPFPEELMICKRYWQKLGNIVVDPSDKFVSYTLPVVMRTAPAVSCGVPGFTIYYNDGENISFYVTTRQSADVYLDARI